MWSILIVLIWRLRFLDLPAIGVLGCETAFWRRNGAALPQACPLGAAMSVGRAQGAPTTHPVRVLKCPGRFCLFSTLTE